MSTTMYATRLAWADRWTHPTIENLVEPLREQHQEGFAELIKQLDGLDHVRREFIWYGESWQWTVRYTLLDDQGDDLDILCYLVANLEKPLVCVPLNATALGAMPTRRLGRFINEGLRSAKCAVDLNWAKWTPNSLTEVNFLLDLIKRKIKLTCPA